MWLEQHSIRRGGSRSLLYRPGLSQYYSNVGNFLRQALHEVLFWPNIKLHVRKDLSWSALESNHLTIPLPYPNDGDHIGQDKFSTRLISSYILGKIMSGLFWDDGHFVIHQHAKWRKAKDFRTRLHCRTPDGDLKSWPVRSWHIYSSIKNRQTYVWCRDQLRPSAGTYCSNSDAAMKIFVYDALVRGWLFNSSLPYGLVSPLPERGPVHNDL